MTIKLKVLNKNDFIITDRYDGVPYTFAPKKPEIIPADAAKHIFGWEPDIDLSVVKAHVCKRWGWNTPQHQHAADRMFKLLQLDKVVYQMVEVADTSIAGMQMIPTKGGEKMPLEGSPSA